MSRSRTSTVQVSFLEPEEEIPRHIQNKYRYPFYGSLDIILPETAAEKVKNSISTHYTYRYFAPLASFLDPVFLGTYIQQNDFTMISETHIDQGDAFAIAKGRLFLFLTAPTYHRAGLQGRKTSLNAQYSGKNKLERFVVEYDLRSSNAMPGNQKFDRLIWSLSNPLNFPLWTQFSITTPDGRASLPLSPEIESRVFGSVSPSDKSTKIVEPRIQVLPHILTPSFYLPEQQEGASTTASEISLESWCWDLLEWTGMAAIGSDRLSELSPVDEYLCRFEMSPEMSPEPGYRQNCVRLSWRGLIPVSLLTEVLRDSPAASGAEWAVVSATAVPDAPLGFNLKRERRFTVTAPQVISVQLRRNELQYRQPVSLVYEVS